jgi:hypothetical protein
LVVAGTAKCERTPAADRPARRQHRPATRARNRASRSLRREQDNRWASTWPSLIIRRR